MFLPAAWFVYIVECADGTYYTGSTPDIHQRVAKHNLGRGAKYTKFRTPVRLIYFEKHLDKSQASQREYQIKQLTREQKEELVMNFFTPSVPARH